MSYKHVLEAALALPKSKRAELLDELHASLAGPEDAGVAAAWHIEIQRRLAEYRTGKAKTFTHEELQRKMKQLRRKHAKIHLPS